MVKMVSARFLHRQVTVLPSPRPESSRRLEAQWADPQDSVRHVWGTHVTTTTATQSYLRGHFAVAPSGAACWRVFIRGLACCQRHCGALPALLSVSSSFPRVLFTIRLQGRFDPPLRSFTYCSSHGLGDVSFWSSSPMRFVLHGSDCSSFGQWIGGSLGLVPGAIRRTLSFHFLPF